MYQAGVVAGGACRAWAVKPPIFILVAKDDLYSAGFRAAYFQRDQRAAFLALRAPAAVRPRGPDASGFRVPSSAGSALA